MKEAGVRVKASAGEHACRSEPAQLDKGSEIASVSSDWRSQPPGVDPSP